MGRLPSPGQDSGVWGEILNEYLQQSHTSAGDLKPGTVGADQLKSQSVTTQAIAPNTVTEAQLSAPVQSKINAQALVTSVNTKQGNVVIEPSDIGLGNVSNTSDAQKPVSTATQTALNAKASKVAGKVPVSEIPDLSSIYALINSTTVPSLQNWYTGLAQRHSRPARIITVADSMTEGTGASTWDKNWMTQLAADYAKTKDLPLHVFIPSFSRHGPEFPYQTGYVQNGATANEPNMSYTTFIPPTNGTLTIPNIPSTYTHATMVYVEYAGFRAPPRYQIGGGPVTTITGAIKNTDLAISELTVALNGATTITFYGSGVTNGDGSSVYGIKLHTSSANQGIEYINLARAGASSDDMRNTLDWGVNNNPVDRNIYQYYPSDLVHIGLAGNDVLKGVSIARMVDNYNWFVDYFTGLEPAGQTGPGSNPSIVMTGHTFPSGTVGVTEAEWNQRIDAIKQVAQDRGCYFVDWRGVIPTQAQAGILYHDNVHPNDNGHTYTADLMASRLLP